MKDPAQPLAEVFGHLIKDQTEKADRYRSYPREDKVTTLCL